MLCVPKGVKGSGVLWGKRCQRNVWVKLRSLVKATHYDTHDEGNRNTVHLTECRDVPIPTFGPIPMSVPIPQLFTDNDIAMPILLPVSARGPVYYAVFHIRVTPLFFFFQFFY